MLHAALEVDLDDMAFDEKLDCFVHKCRCSDKFQIYESDLEKGCDTFECPSCSLRIRVLFEEAT